MNLVNTNYILREAEFISLPAPGSVTLFATVKNRLEVEDRTGYCRCILEKYNEGKIIEIQNERER